MAVGGCIFVRNLRGSVQTASQTVTLEASANESDLCRESIPRWHKVRESGGSGTEGK